MAKPELTLDDLRGKIPSINESNRRYAEGDHWQEGEGYSGSLLNASDARFQEWIANKERIFVSMDILSEVRKRERWALTGKAWTWELLDGDNQELPEAEVEELNRYIKNWFEEKQVVSTVADCIENSSWSGEDGEKGRGILRFFIPPNRLEGGRAQAENLGEALSMIELESPDSGSAVVFQDADSEYEPVGFASWDEEKAGVQLEKAELVYVNEQGMTVIEAYENEVSTSTEINLLKKLTMYQMSRPLLMTSSMRSQQKFLNHTLTAFQATISDAGWPENFFFGAMPPGEWIDNDTFVAEPMEIGPGRSHFLQPQTTETAEGEKKAIQSASHSVKPQASPHLFTEAKKDARENILATAFQEFTSLTGLAQASGEKLQLAKGDFEASVTDMANETRLMVRWVIETALALAEGISSGTSEPPKYNAIVDVHIDTGVVTTEQKTQLSQLVAEGFIAQRSALTEAGYSNPEGEMLEIQKEGGQTIAQKSAAAAETAAQQAADAGSNGSERSEATLTQQT